MPSYEAVDVLRRASNNKDIAEEDYAHIRKYVLEEGKDAKDVQKDMTRIIKRNEELDPEEVYKKKRSVRVKRFLSVLKSIRNEINISKTFSDKISKETDRLIAMIEDEMS